MMTNHVVYLGLKNFLKPCAGSYCTCSEKEPNVTEQLSLDGGHQRKGILVVLADVLPLPWFSFPEYGADRIKADQREPGLSATGTTIPTAVTLGMTALGSHLSGV